MSRLRHCFPFVTFVSLVGAAAAQMSDVHQTPNAVNEGIKKSLTDQVGSGRGSALSPGSSLYLIARDPFRSIARGRQLFQRKFTVAQGLGPRTHDGTGDIQMDASHGAGLADSCAACHGRPRGSAGHGGDVFTRPASRDAPHLFGLGLVEMLADEITHDLREIRDDAAKKAAQTGKTVVAKLKSKGIHYGKIQVDPFGHVDASKVEGVDADLRVKPFFAEGSEFSIRSFVVGALNAEMGLETFDPDLASAANGLDVVTPSGMVLSGSIDEIAPPPASSPSDDPDLDGVVNEVDAALVDHLEFYLLNYFRPATHHQGATEKIGRALFEVIGCAGCHVPNLVIQEDRRVADVATEFDDQHAIFNQLFATAAPRFDVIDDMTGHPALKPPSHKSFVVHDIYADFKRHDLGPAFHELNFDGTVTTEFMTEPLWGVGTTAPYGHDGRSVGLRDVILRHGGEAQLAKKKFEGLPDIAKLQIESFLRSLVLFPPADTASNLDPGNPNDPLYPLVGHGSIDLSVLFVVPNEKE